MARWSIGLVENLLPQPSRQEKKRHQLTPHSPRGQPVCIHSHLDNENREPRFFFSVIVGVQYSQLRIDGEAMRNLVFEMYFGHQYLVVIVIQRAASFRYSTVKVETGKSQLLKRHIT